MKVTAVVCAYWPNRFPNIQQIVDSLRSSTRPPDTIIVLNNNPEVQLSFDGAKVLNSQENFRCRSKYSVGLLNPSDYYILLDDDTAVGKRTIEKYLSFARRDICSGYLGVTLSDLGSFHHGGRIWPTEIQSETPCQTFCGCGMFMSWAALLRLHALEEWIRLPGEWPHEGDDIIAGLANKSTVVPLSKSNDEWFVDLDWKEQAMSYDPVYYEMRDRFTLYVLGVLKKHPVPEI